MTNGTLNTRSQRCDRHTRGVILLALLIGLALSGIALMGAVDIWTLQRQREREQQLLYVGDQYRLAIGRYYYAAPAGTPKTLPATLEMLLEDDRFPVPVRHLRRLYPDPITGHAEWGQLRSGERILGIYSLSEAKPVKQAGFSVADESFTGRAHYKEWIFSFSGAPATVVIMRPGAITKKEEKSYSPLQHQEGKNEHPHSSD